MSLITDPTGLQLNSTINSTQVPNGLVYQFTGEIYATDILMIPMIFMLSMIVTVSGFKLHNILVPFLMLINGFDIGISVLLMLVVTVGNNIVRLWHFYRKNADRDSSRSAIYSLPLLLICLHGINGACVGIFVLNYIDILWVLSLSYFLIIFVWICNIYSLTHDIIKIRNKNDEQSVLINHELNHRENIGLPETINIDAYVSSHQYLETHKAYTKNEIEHILRRRLEYEEICPNDSYYPLDNFLINKSKDELFTDKFTTFLGMIWICTFGAIKIIIGDDLMNPVVIILEIMIICSLGIITYLLCNRPSNSFAILHGNSTQLSSVESNRNTTILYLILTSIIDGFSISLIGGSFRLINIAYYEISADIHLVSGTMFSLVISVFVVLMNITNIGSNVGHVIFYLAASMIGTYVGIKLIDKQHDNLQILLSIIMNTIIFSSVILFCIVIYQY